MANANSVIPTWLETFNLEFYTSLTAKEDWSYTNQGLASWQPIYQALANALDAYRSYNRDDEVYNFMNSSYAYVILHYNFGTDGSLLSSLNANSVYSINGFMAQTIARPVNYYNDLTAPVPPATDYNSPLMTASIAQVTAAPTAEAANLTSLQASTHGTVQSFTSFSLWSDIVVTGSYGKPFMRETFFIDFGWKAVITSLNIGYTIPAGV